MPFYTLTHFLVLSPPHKNQTLNTLTGLYAAVQRVRYFPTIVSTSFVDEFIFGGLKGAQALCVLYRDRQ